MKKITIITLLLGMLFSTPIFAQSFSYQTVIRNDNRQLIVNKDVDFKFRIFKGSANGDEVYTESQSTRTNEFGLANLQIGAGNNQNGDIIDLDWGEDIFFLEVAIKLDEDPDFLTMGTSQILGVPYALHSETTQWELSDEDRDPTNEHQSIQKSNTTVTLSDGGGSFELLDEDPTNEHQTIEKFGSQITLSKNGGTIELLDDSPDNEIQDLTLDLWGNTLHIGDWTSSISLASFMDSKWTQGTWGIYRTGNVGIGTTSPNARLDVSSTFALSNLSNLNKIYASAGSVGYYESRGSNNSENVIMSSLVQNGVSYPSNGAIGLYGIQGTDLPDNDPVPAILYVGPDGNGYLALSGSKSFRVPYPGKPNKEIWYACVEGPEAAAYERGTGILENGEVFVQFSNHFKEIINAETTTVILTPLDASSKGLAVIEKTDNGFKVKELGGGTGTYQFDWEIKGVRKGHENFQVVREAGAASLERSDVRNTNSKPDK